MGAAATMAALKIGRGGDWVMAELGQRRKVGREARRMGRPGRETDGRTRLVRSEERKSEGDDGSALAYSAPTPNNHNRKTHICSRTLWRRICALSFSPCFMTRLIQKSQSGSDLSACLYM